MRPPPTGCSFRSSICTNLHENARATTSSALTPPKIDLGFDGNGPALVRGDPMLLGELLSNLIENAIAYAGPGRRGDGSRRCRR
jgi:signal transduction histidine kinase